MKRPEPPVDRIVWIDTETTGLNEFLDKLLEIAIVITDAELREVAVFSEVVRYETVDEVRVLMDEYVREMHRSSGLLVDLAAANEDATVQRIEARIVEFLTEHDALNAVVAGSSIDFDRGFLDVRMPHLERDVLHYRAIDVSTVKELARRFAPDVLAAAPSKTETHRALVDIRESIAELAHYRDAGLFTPSPTAAQEGANR